MLYVFRTLFLPSWITNYFILTTIMLPGVSSYQNTYSVIHDVICRSCCVLASLIWHWGPNQEKLKVHVNVSGTLSIKGRPLSDKCIKPLLQCTATWDLVHTWAIHDLSVISDYSGVNKRHLRCPCSEHNCKKIIFCYSSSKWVDRCLIFAFYIYFG